jgi:hypothetical protein
MPERSSTFQDLQDPEAHGSAQRDFNRFLHVKLPNNGGRENGKRQVRKGIDR